MMYVDEFRDPIAVRAWVDAICRSVGEADRTWRLMEICGGQTHNIIKFGIDQMLPKQVELVHGPGCPVCVTPVSMIDAAIAIAKNPNVILCSFGDMLRVPGSGGSLLTARAEGADVRIVYSPKEAAVLAEALPHKEVVFFAVGFETTAPANAAAVAYARNRGLKNFSVLVSHVLVPPAIEALLGDKDNTIQGFLAAGHVCTITGYEDYYDLARRFQVPIIVTGFEPLDILQGIYLAIGELKSHSAGVINQYSRSVRLEGNTAARALLSEIFEVCDREWRGMGTIPKSGLRLRPELRDFDAAIRWPEAIHRGIPEDTSCKAGSVLQGKIRPTECPQFGVRCTPTQPLGAPMVSNEGACAAYYLYKHKETQHA